LVAQRTGAVFWHPFAIPFTLPFLILSQAFSVGFNKRPLLIKLPGGLQVSLSQHHSGWSLQKKGALFWGAFSIDILL